MIRPCEGRSFVQCLQLALEQGMYCEDAGAVRLLGLACPTRRAHDCA